MVRGPQYRGNKYDGTCEICGQTVPAGRGRVRRVGNRRWVSSHLPREWKGSPISGDWVGGCPPTPPKTAPDTPDGTVTAESPESGAGTDAGLDAARVELYLRLFGEGRPPRYRDPGTDQGRERLDADIIRLAAMNQDGMLNDPEAMATLLEISDHQGWDS